MDSVQLLYIHQLYVLLILYRISWIQSSRSLVDIVDPMTPCQATRGLNLSEDIFAGLDLSLRGGWTVYREYFHVGKAQGLERLWHPNSLRDFRFQISDMDFIGDSLSLTCRLVWVIQSSQRSQRLAPTRANYQGRDMGFMSVLSFYAKVSMGNAEQAGCFVG